MVGLCFLSSLSYLLSILYACIHSLGVRLSFASLNLFSSFCTLCLLQAFLVFLQLSLLLFIFFRLSHSRKPFFCCFSFPSSVSHLQDFLIFLLPSLLCLLLYLYLANLSSFSLLNVPSRHNK